MTQTGRKIYHVHGLEELTLLKWPCYSGQLTDGMQFLSKKPSNLFCGYWQSDPKAYMERQTTQNVQHNPEGE